MFKMGSVPNAHRLREKIEFLERSAELMGRVTGELASSLQEMQQKIKGPELVPQDKVLFNTAQAVCSLMTMAIGFTKTACEAEKEVLKVAEAIEKLGNNPTEEELADALGEALGNIEKKQPNEPPTKFENDKFAQYEDEVPAVTPVPNDPDEELASDSLLQREIEDTFHDIFEKKSKTDPDFEQKWRNLLEDDPEDNNKD